VHRRVTAPDSNLIGLPLPPTVTGRPSAKRVAVVELGVNNGNGDGGSCFGIEVRTVTAKLINMVTARFGDR